jgi:cobyrinic acid a,c-diamide synthase
VTHDSGPNDDFRGLIVAAPSSGSGKTLVTLAMLRALKRSGVNLSSAKVGPDYIDPAFHTLASGKQCLNVDTWAMRPELIAHRLGCLSQSAELIVAEGVMGLFDGAGIDDEERDGSTASLARNTGWPIVLIVDARAQAASVAAVVRGFSTHAADVTVAGVIFNRVGSDNHGNILRSACAKHVPHIPVLGCLPRRETLVLPERHLGLVQAAEHENLEEFFDNAADWFVSNTDMDALLQLAENSVISSTPSQLEPISPLGQRIAIAQDQAFAFSYAGVLQDWRAAGSEIIPFSPLSGEKPDKSADSVYLPGGYPELFAGTLASNGFVHHLRETAARGVSLFGECGGYMVLGTGLIDRDGTRHEMAGLLDVETSFADRKLHLGYRQMTTLKESALGSQGTGFRGHEFHYASILSECKSSSLFDIKNAAGDELGAVGQIRGNVSGSFMHLIDVVNG